MYMGGICICIMQYKLIVYKNSVQINTVHSSMTDGAVKREEFYEALKIIPKEIFLYVTNTDTVLAI